MKTVALFRSTDFNHTEPRDYFINPCCFGDDLARWLLVELALRGVEVAAEPGQEDFGWYFGFTAEDKKYCAVIGGDGDGAWYVVVERACGFFASLFGGRHRGVSRAAVAAIEGVLSGAERISDLHWQSWKEFRGGDARAA